MINQYKNYARLHLAQNDVRNSAIRQFLTAMDTNLEIQQMYDIYGYVAELYDLENQYIQLKKQLPFISFLESFLDRIANYAKRISASSIDNTHVKVLSFLWTTAMSKICSINQHSKGETIVDVHLYLGQIRNSIEKFHEIGVQQTIQNHERAFNDTLNAKIESCKHLVHSQLLPEIDNIFKNTNDKLIELVNENIEKQNEARDNIDEQQKRQRALENNMLWHSILYPIKLVSNFASFLGPIGAGVGAAVGGAASIAEGMVIDENAAGGSEINALNSKFAKAVTKITNDLNNDILLLKEQIVDIENRLNELNPTELPKTRSKIIEVKCELERLLDESHKYDPAVPDHVRVLRQELLNVINNEEKDLVQQNFFARSNGTNAKELLGHAQNVLQVVGTSVDFYKTIKNDHKQIEQVSKAIQALEMQLKILEQHKIAIFKVMMPKIAAIRDTFAAAADWDGKSHVELDIGKWQIQSTLRDMKQFFKLMTKDFEVQDDLLRCIEQLEEAMTAMIDVYNRIDTYADDAKLVAYIADIHSSTSKGINITDPILKRAIIDFEYVIQSNIILEQYEIALNAFKPHYFPFAHLFLKEFDLPSELQTNDTQTVISTTINRIDKMKEKIIEAKYQIGEYDKYRKSDVPFDNEMQNSQSFYVWKHRENANAIAKLLRGEKIALLADITRGINHNAVKFKEISIKFKMSNATEQNQLTEILNGFKITMSMVSNNYYRCGNFVLSMPVSNKVVIEYNLRRDPNGNPTVPNDVYRKIQENNYFLSPYAMWYIQLNDVDKHRYNFNALADFINKEIDLELVGLGQYIIANTIEQEICTEQLENFYSREDVPKTKMLN